MTPAQRQKEREEALLEAALELFGTEGYAKTSVRDVCQLAYVSTRDFYASFANREELFQRVNERVQRQVNGWFLEGFRESRLRSVRGRTLDGIRAAIRAIAADRRVTRIAYVESVTVSAVQAVTRRQAVGEFAAGLADLLAEDFKKVRIPPARARALCLGLLGAINELIANEVLGDDDMAPDALADYVVDTISLMLPTPRR
jgi:AcrR family transcriptional regulator